MLPYAIYLFKVIICSGVLFGYYWLMLRNKIFHNYNRFYLLAAILLSLIVPLLQIKISTAYNTPQAIKMLQVINGSGEYFSTMAATGNHTNLTASQFLLFLYAATCMIFLCLFINGLIRIYILLKKNSCKVVSNIYFISTTAKGTPFSFFKYIFWNENINIKTATGNQIFKHEVVHVQQKHSYDKLFINSVLIFFWLNPFFWLIRKELNMIHEFIADKKAVDNGDTEAFASMILQAAYPQHRFQLANTFFYSPIKRRLLMLTKNYNTKAGYIGRILVLPLAFLVFAAFTLKTTKADENFTGTYHGKKITVVIDAGHGGSDNGAVSLTGNIHEKDLTLAIAKKIKALNDNPDINIVLTRENDVDLSPQQRTTFTKAQNANLFISIHIDAATNDSANTMSVWVAKDNYANAAKSKLFASAIINQFSDNYGLPVAPLPQQRQQGIWVLQDATCPSVLIEAGFITNKKDLDYLQSEDAVIAKNILASINNYAFAKNNNEVINYKNNDNNRSSIVNIDTLSGKPIMSIYNSLIIIDGKETDSTTLKTLDPNTIESMSVYKGKNAVLKYGDKGKNGVVVIALKKKHVQAPAAQIPKQRQDFQKPFVNDPA